MSTETEQLNVLLEQTQNDFMPPVKIQIDITQMQSILQGMCKQMVRMQTEIDGLKNQLKSKASQNELLNLNSQIHNKIESVIENNNDSVNQINSNMENLKNALIAGLEKCQSDALNVARDLVAEVKPITAQAESRKSSSQSPRSKSPSEPQVSFIQTPIPTSDLEELTRQLQALSERVIQIEENRDIPAGDLREKMSELGKRAKEISQNNSNHSSTVESPTIGQRLIGSPDLQTTNHLYDLNEAIRTINERLLQLEGGVTDQSKNENQINQNVPSDVYQQLKEHSEQIKKLTEELNINRTENGTPHSPQAELPNDDREAISQLNNRLSDIENNFSNFKNTTKNLNDQVNGQKTQLDEYKKLLEQYKDELKSSIDSVLEKNETFKELYNLDSKKNENNQNEDDNENNLIDDEDEQADESDNSMDTPRLKSRVPPSTENIPKSQPPPINTDELLDSFLDATRVEVDKAKKVIMDELSTNVRNVSSQLSGNISKQQATIEIGLKKVNSLINDQITQLQTDLKNHNFEQQNTIKDLHVANADLSEKLRLLEQRVDTVMKMSKSPPPKMEALIDSRGKLDLAPLLSQIQSHTALFEDLSNRIGSLEERDHISPATFNGALETLSGHETKLVQLELNSIQIEGSVAEVKDALEEMKKKSSPEEESRLKELFETTTSLDSETKRLCEAMVKFNKDLISCRAAINTLRSHSEETSGSVEDIMKMCEQAREDCASTDKRLKKLITFMQDENREMTNQIKDISRSVERNADRIEELANKKSDSYRSTITEGEEEEEEEEEEEDGSTRTSSKATTPKSGKKAKSKAKSKQEPQQAAQDQKTANEVKYENVMTSPHLALPPLEEKKDDELLIPKISPHTLQKHNQAAAAQPIVIDQPLVTVVGRNGAAKMPLPRLAKVPGQPLRSSSELTKNDLKKYDDLFNRLDQLEQKFSVTKSAVDGLNKQVKTLQDNKAEKDALQALFDQFRLAMGELNNRIGSLRKNIIQKADISELVQVRTDILREIKIQGETAAGTEPVRCLLCGNPRHSVTGAFDAASLNPMSVKPAGPSVSSRVSGADGSVCYVYGENGQMYLGRSQDGKPIVLSNLMTGAGNEGNGAPIQGTVPLPDAQ